MFILFICLVTTGCILALDDAGLCSLVASTNINTIHSVWSCNVSGDATSDYCTWPAVACDGDNNVVEIVFSPNSEAGLAGSLFKSEYLNIIVFIP